MLITVLQSVSFYQLWNVGPLWTRQQVALDLGAFAFPCPGSNRSNSIASVAGVPLLLWIWRRQARKGREPNDLAKIAGALGWRRRAI